MRAARGVGALPGPLPCAWFPRLSASALDCGPVLCSPLFQHMTLCGHFVPCVPPRESCPKAVHLLRNVLVRLSALLTELPSLSSSAQPWGLTPALLV